MSSPCPYNSKSSCAFSGLKSLEQVSSIILVVGSVNAILPHISVMKWSLSIMSMCQSVKIRVYMLSADVV